MTRTAVVFLGGVLLAAAAPATVDGGRDGGSPDASITVEDPRLLRAERDTARALVEVERVKREAAERDAARWRADVQKLEAELAEVRRRLAAAEAASSGAGNTETSRRLDTITRELGEVRGLLEAERDEKQDRERLQAERQGRADAAIAALGTAQATLASGSVSGVESALRIAEGAFSGPARQYVDAARRALQNSDLSATRSFLALAIAEASAGRY